MTELPADARGLTAADYVKASWDDLRGLLAKGDAPAWVLILTDEVMAKHTIALRDRTRARG